MNQQKVGSLLKDLRKEKGLTQEQLAECFGVSARTVSRWETGSNMPDISLLMELADFYCVDIREILDGERKSEKMNEEVKETIQKVADYADAEKALLLKRARIISFVGLDALLIGLIMESIASNSTIPVYEYVKGCCFGLAVGALITMCLYTTGVLAKIKEKKSKNMKIIAVVCFILMAVLLIASVVASLL